MRDVVRESVLITYNTDNALGHEREIPTIPLGNRSYVAEQVIIYLLDARRAALCGSRALWGCENELRPAR